MNTDTQWLRTSKARRCPVCGKSDWCMVTADGSAALCMRTSDGAVRRTRNGGYLHRLSADRRVPRSIRGVVLLDRTPSRHDLPTLAKQYQTAVNPGRLRRLADGLGLSVASLQRLRIGWASDSGAWAFPMLNAGGDVVGIRLRLDNGRKFSVTGGREGLYIPDDLPDVGELLVTEGPTDCAALLDFGFAAVGRPSCTGGVRLLVELVQARKPQGVVIVADADEPGQRGAEVLAAVLVLYCRRVRIVTPPAGVKDARAWKQSGASAADVQSAIDAAPIRTLRIVGNRAAQGAGA